MRPPYQSKPISSNASPGPLRRRIAQADTGKPGDRHSEALGAVDVSAMRARRHAPLRRTGDARRGGQLVLGSGADGFYVDGVHDADGSIQVHGVGRVGWRHVVSDLVCVEGGGTVRPPQRHGGVDGRGQVRERELGEDGGPGGGGGAELAASRGIRVSGDRDHSIPSF